MPSRRGLTRGGDRRLAPRVAAALLGACALRGGPVAAQSLGPPVSPTCVTSPFGPRVLPGKPLAGTFHWGIDLAAPVGATVRAAAAGHVLSIRRHGPGGLQIVLGHPGFTTLYAHLGRVSARLAEGQSTVRAGEALGVVGRTGVSYGAHLYFELRRDGQRIDPAPFLAVSRCDGHHAAPPAR